MFLNNKTMNWLNSKKRTWKKCLDSLCIKPSQTVKNYIQEQNTGN
jgi:hypothetical protein